MLFNIVQVVQVVQPFVQYCNGLVCRCAAPRSWPRVTCGDSESARDGPGQPEAGSAEAAVMQVYLRGRRARRPAGPADGEICSNVK